MITCVGSYGVGITFRVPRVPSRGETITGAQLAMGHGGKTSNQAIAAARQGASVSLVTVTGNDTFGENARRLWEDEGIDASDSITLEGSETMAGMILVESDGANRIAIAPGALDHLTPALLEEHRGAIEQADVVVITLEIPVETAERAVKIAHDAGAVVILNPAPAAELSAQTIALADYFIPNETEYEFYSAQGYRRPVGQKLIVTRGSQGARLESDDGVHQFAPIEPDEPVIDTTGAGDTFVGAFSAAIDAKLPIDDCMNRAIAASALSVTVREVVPSIPREDAVTSLLKKVGRA